MTIRRESTDSPVPQGKDEAITYYIDFASWGASSTNPVTTPVVKLYDNDGVDVTSSKLSGSPSVVNDTQVFLPRCSALASGIRYRIECQVVFAGDTWEAWAYITGED